MKFSDELLLRVVQVLDQGSTRREVTNRLVLSTFLLLAYKMSNKPDPRTTPLADETLTNQVSPNLVPLSSKFSMPLVS